MKSELIVAALAAAIAARPAPQGVTDQIAPSAAIPGNCAVNYAGKFGIAVITDIKGRRVEPAAPSGAAVGPAVPLPPPGMPMDKRMAQPQITSAPAAPGAGSPDSTVTVRKTRTHTRTVTVRPIRATAAPAAPAPAAQAPELAMPVAGPTVDTYTGPHVNLLMVSQIGDGQIQAPITPVPVPIPAPMPLPTVAPSGARTVTQISDGQPQAPMDTRAPTAVPAGAGSGAVPPSGPPAGPMPGPVPAGPVPDGSMPGGPMPGGPMAGGPPPDSSFPGLSGPPPAGMSLGLTSGGPSAGGPLPPPPGAMPAGAMGAGSMPADGMSLGLAGAPGAPLPPAGAVNRVEDSPQAPTEGSDLSINRAMMGDDAGPGTLAACMTNGTLALTLNNGVLKDNKGRTGYIASNRQFQFDDPPQHGSIYTAGFSVCSNGSLALGGSAVWWQCLSGNFYNLYDQWIAPQCHPIHISTIKLNQC